MSANKEKPMTWGEMAAFCATLTDEQKAMPVQWWGDERGGEVKRVDVLREDFVDMDYGYEPASTFDDNPDYDLTDVDRLVAGTPILSVD